MMEAPERKAGIPFAYDEIISVHSQEPILNGGFNTLIQISHWRVAAVNWPPIFGLRKKGMERKYFPRVISGI